jgi:hypothetical protein
MISPLPTSIVAPTVLRKVLPRMSGSFSLYPISSTVNTKNWYRKGTDLWAKFGKEMPFGRKISLEDSVKMLAVSSTPSFGRRTACA